MTSTPAGSGFAIRLSLASVVGSANSVIVVTRGDGCAVAFPLRWAASGTLAIMAARTMVVAVRRYRSAALQAPAGLRLTSPLRAYAALAGLTALNPVTAAYFGALVLNSQATGAFTAARSGVFVACVFVASVSWQLLLVTGGTLLGRVMTGRRGMLALALFSAVLIMLLARCERHCGGDGRARWPWQSGEAAASAVSPSRLGENWHGCVALVSRGRFLRPAGREASLWSGFGSRGE